MTLSAWAFASSAFPRCFTSIANPIFGNWVICDAFQMILKIIMKQIQTDYNSIIPTHWVSQPVHLHSTTPQPPQPLKNWEHFRSSNHSTPQPVWSSSFQWANQSLLCHSVSDKFGESLNISRLTVKKLTLSSADGSLKSKTGSNLLYSQ